MRPSLISTIHLLEVKDRNKYEHELYNKTGKTYIEMLVVVSNATSI